MKLKTFSLSLIALLSVFPVLSVSGQGQAKFEPVYSEELLAEKAEDEDVNILVYDEDGKIVSEFHSDGVAVNYTYEDGIMVSSEDSAGAKEEYSISEDVLEVKQYFNDKLIDTKVVNIDDQEEQLSIESGFSILATNEDYIVKNIRMNDFITNSQLTNTSELNASQIQKFFDERKSILADHVEVYIKDKDGKVKTTNQRVLPSALIFNAQRDYNISAKVIIALIQKESSLVAEKRGAVPFNSRRFYYVMGNGATDKGDLNGTSGFDKQIKNGAKTLKNLYEEGKKKSFPYKMPVNDGKSVKKDGVTYKGEIWARNAATYAMYRYTPWTIDTNLLPEEVGGGNYLYIKCYKMFW